MELPFAALQQVCAPLMDRIQRLPDPQQDALRVTFGLRSGHPPDRFLVGLAVLTLLSTVAEEQPLLCVVDDAQWLDRASTDALAFVARRLLAESLGLLFASRKPAGSFRGLPELVIEGLGNGDARALLGWVIGWPLDERVRDRIVSETRGNPLALVELPRELTAADMAGGFGLPQPRALSSRIEASFRQRVEPLPAETQRLLLVAAAEPVGDPMLLWRAADGLGIGAEAAAPAEAAGLIEFGVRVRFRHPLVRSAVYRAASLADRRSAHRALGDATDPEADPDRRAWHRAHATPSRDEDVACELEHSATRAQARGGLAAAAAFMEQASRLTPDPARRAARALAAARSTHLAGAPDAALALLNTAQAGPLDELQRARVDLLGAQIAFASKRGNDAPPLLLKAAKRLEPLDPALARDTHLEALWAAIFAGRFATSHGLLEAAQAARAAPPAPQPPRPSDLLLDGLAVLIRDGHEAGLPTLKRALSAFRHERITREVELRWLPLAIRAAFELCDDEACDVLSSRHVQLARDTGALSDLPLALNNRIGVHLSAGTVPAAAALLQELQAVTEATGSQLAPYGALGLAAWRGREAEFAEQVEAATRELVARGEGFGLSAIEWTAAVLYNSLGRYEDALAAAQQAIKHPEELAFARWALVELIEAATRTAKPRLAVNALRRLLETTRGCGTDWALGIEARSRALLADGTAAETLYLQAIEALERTRVRSGVARTCLLYGEWLRRERRRLDAREQLRRAHELFSEFGMDAFAERARVELQATGERARKRTPETRDHLTPQEAQISRLAAEGARNQEIAAQLFISPSTVDYHLRKAFRKLGVKSRTQLARRILQTGAGAKPAARGD
jgi:DNA-binding CsgD family transcriptional regulator